MLQGTPCQNGQNECMLKYVSNDIYSKYMFGFVHTELIITSERLVIFMYC